MKTHLNLLVVLFVLLASLHRASAQGTTAFTYQGQLHDDGTNANGAYTMIFKLYDSSGGGTQIGSTISTSAMLANGLFSVNLDFGNAFDGSARWLDITVTNGGTAQELSPRVQLLPAPYALYSANAGNLASGTWNASVGNFQGNTNVFGIFANSSLVLGLSTNGVLVNGELQADNLKLDTLNGASISGDGQGGIQLDGSITASNLTLNGSTIQFPAQFGASINVDSDGDFTFDGNIKMTALGVLHFPGPSSGGGDISGVNSGLLIDSSLQVNQDLNVNGNFSVAGTTSGNFNQSSDRNLKEKFTPINPQEILERVASLPITSWNYKTDGNIRHIGPMAQDFYSTFNVGTDDRHIGVVDEGGVALAAIQGLNQKVEDEARAKDAKIGELEKQLSDLERQVKALALQQTEGAK